MVESPRFPIMGHYNKYFPVYHIPLSSWNIQKYFPVYHILMKYPLKYFPDLPSISYPLKYPWHIHQMPISALSSRRQTHWTKRLEPWCRWTWHKHICVYMIIMIIMIIILRIVIITIIIIYNIYTYIYIHIHKGLPPPAADPTVIDLAQIARWATDRNDQGLSAWYVSGTHTHL